MGKVIEIQKILNKKLKPLSKKTLNRLMSGLRKVLFYFRLKSFNFENAYSSSDSDFSNLVSYSLTKLIVGNIIVSYPELTKVFAINALKKG